MFDHTPPPAPSIPQAATPTRDLPNLTWSSGGADALSGFDHYVVYRDGVAVGTPTSPTFLDADLATLGPHLYVVRAVDVAGNVSGSSPRAPSSTTRSRRRRRGADGPSPTNAPDLSWTASNDDGTGGSGVVGYGVYRDGQLIATPTSPTFADGRSRSRARTPTGSRRRRGRQREPRLADEVVAVDLDPPQAPPDLTRRARHSARR